MTVTLRCGTSVTFYRINDRVLAHFPGDVMPRNVGMITAAGKGRFAWTLASNEYWAGYSTVYKLPICTSVDSAYQQLVAYVSNNA